MFSTHPIFAELNQHSLTAPRVHVINADAFPWLDSNAERFDFVVVDFPDPTSYALGKLYTTTFYRLLARHLSENGLVVVQSTSPLFARQSYWCIVETLKQAGFKTFPYHVYVPAFGEWGYVIGSLHDYQPPHELPAGLKYLSVRILPDMFTFPNDMLPVAAQPNRLNDQVLVRYYEDEWKVIAR